MEAGRDLQRDLLPVAPSPAPPSINSQRAWGSPAFL